MGVEISMNLTNINKKGKYTAKITYKGNKKYKATTKKIKITVSFKTIGKNSKNKKNNQKNTKNTKEKRILHIRRKTLPKNRRNIPQMDTKSSNTIPKSQKTTSHRNSQLPNSKKTKNNLRN